MVKDIDLYAKMYITLEWKVHANQGINNRVKIKNILSLYTNCNWAHGWNVQININEACRLDLTENVKWNVHANISETCKVIWQKRYKWSAYERLSDIIVRED